MLETTPISHESKEPSWLKSLFTYLIGWLKCFPLSTSALLNHVIASLARLFYSRWAFPLLGIPGQLRTFRYKLGNIFSIGQYFSGHPISYNQSTVGVGTLHLPSPFVSISKNWSNRYFQADISEPLRISASAKFQSLPQSALMTLLTQSSQGSKGSSFWQPNRRQVRRWGSVTVANPRLLTIPEISTPLSCYGLVALAP